MIKNINKRNFLNCFISGICIFLCSCNNGGGSSSASDITLSAMDSNIAYSSMTLVYPPGDTNDLTQYVNITVNDSKATPGNKYSLYYVNPIMGRLNQSKNYSLCTINTSSKSCTGSIPMSDFVVYNSNSFFYIVRNNSTPSTRYTASIINNTINTGLNNHNGAGIATNAWNTYQCGLEYIWQTIPAPECTISTNKSTNLSLKVSNGCPTINSDITNSVAAFYYPNKFGDNKYGISCTAVPIGDGSWVITGGHCVGSGSGGFFAPANQVYVMAGKNQLQNEYTPDEIKRVGIAVEAEYLLKDAGNQSKCQNNCQYYADFALLKLKHKLSNPVALVDKSTPLAKGEQVWIAGYGEHNVSGGTIRNGQLNFRNEYFYSQNMNNGVLYSVGTMPDQYGYSWKFDGNGDSGGPLFIVNNNKLYLISTLTGGTYFDNAGINCKFPGTQIENMSVQYWEDDINGIINGTLPADKYIVSSN